MLLSLQCLTCIVMPTIMLSWYSHLFTDLGFSAFFRHISSLFFPLKYCTAQSLLIYIALGIILLHQLVLVIQLLPLGFLILFMK